MTTPAFTGLKVFDDYDLEELSARIDWTPFFRSWDLAGVYPRILDDEHVGDAARGLFEDAQTMLQRLIDDKRVRARAVIGFWPANSVGDDIELYADAKRAPCDHLSHLETANAPRPRARQPGVGRFHRAKRHGLDRLYRRLRGHHGTRCGDHRENTRRNTMTTTPSWSRRSRTGWRRPSPSACTSGCARNSGGTHRDEDLDNEALIRESYQGIRPAPGYPACPDHTEKRNLFELLQAPDNAGSS